jgi:hypothetical protein
VRCGGTTVSMGEFPSTPASTRLCRDMAGRRPCAGVGAQLSVNWEGMRSDEALSTFKGRGGGGRRSCWAFVRATSPHWPSGKASFAKLEHDLLYSTLKLYLIDLINF